MEQKRTNKKKAFLAAFKELGNIRSACRLGKCSRTNVYRWLKEDAKFVRAFDVAKVEAQEALEQEAYRRAVRGTDKPVFYLGEQCGAIREYSDTLLIFLLKGANPQKYRENAMVQHGGTVGVEHSGSVAVTQVLQELELKYGGDIDELARRRIAGTDAGLLCGNGQQGSMEAGSARNGDGPGRNGHDPGSNGKGADH